MPGTFSAPDSIPDSMPERTFGRTVRFRRTKLGLSQAKLGELVGRSSNTIRSWERDRSIPNDPKVLTALAAILGVDEKYLFEKAGQSVPETETSPTIEEELATLDPDLAEGTTFGEAPEVGETIGEPVEETPVEEIGPPQESFQPPLLEEAEMEAPEPGPITPAPSYAAPPVPYSVSAAVPPAHEPSYMEDSAQRQLYRVRNLATIVVLVALGIAFLWALSEGFGALGDWWDEFFGNLRL